MWIGTNVTLLPLHNPIELAEVGAFMDVVTGGKFLLGVGLGYRPEEYEMYGVAMSERASRLAEGVEIVKRLWSEDRVTHRGRHWQFSDASIRPRPLQSPRPPIIIGAQVEAAIKRAATIGDGWLVVPIPTLDQLAKQMSLYTSARSAAQLPPSPHICRLLEVGCGPDDDTALRRIAPFLMEKYKAYFSWGSGGTDPGCECHPGATVPRPCDRSLRRRRAGQGDRHAGGTTSRRYYPPVDAGKLAGHGPGRHPRRHRAAGTRGAPGGAAPDRSCLAPMTSEDLAKEFGLRALPSPSCRRRVFDTTRGGVGGAQERDVAGKRFRALPLVQQTTAFPCGFTPTLTPPHQGEGNPVEQASRAQLR